MYFSAWWEPDGLAMGGDGASIYRAELDGSNVETLVSTRNISREFVLDFGRGQDVLDVVGPSPNVYSGG